MGHNRYNQIGMAAIERVRIDGPKPCIKDFLPKFLSMIFGDGYIRYRNGAQI